MELEEVDKDGHDGRSSRHVVALVRSVAVAVRRLGAGHNCSGGDACRCDAAAEVPVTFAQNADAAAILRRHELSEDRSAGGCG